MLDILRHSDGSAAATGVAQRFVAHEQLGDMVEGPNSHLPSHFAAVLDRFYKQDLVRSEQSDDNGTRWLWEINR